MNIFLTFDIEVWCNDWNTLDERFPAAFNRYVYGRSKSGDYALPKTLEILSAYQVKGVFFVEPLFAARFGIEYLKEIVDLIQSAEQEVQLHLHPEWTDEIRPLPFPEKSYKRQHLLHYTLEEQIHLIKFGIDLLYQADAKNINAFRAGSFAANADTLRAAHACGLSYDSSLNMCFDISGPDLRSQKSFYFPRTEEDIQLVPMTVIKDGYGRLRHAQVGACSFLELKESIEASADIGHECFTILSHNFEMLRSGSCKPDWIVAKRFEKLCRFLDQRRNAYPTRGFHEQIEWSPEPPSQELASCSRIATFSRLAEQIARRIL